MALKRKAPEKMLFGGFIDRVLYELPPKALFVFRRTPPIRQRLLKRMVLMAKGNK